MKVAYKIFIAVFVILVALFLATRSFRSSKEMQVINSPAYVKAIYSMPVSYDPIKMNDGASLIFSELVYEGLLRFTEDFGVQAGIAESWSTSPDGLVLTFKLNPKAKFHSGDKVTANDVKVSLMRNLSPESVVFKYYDVIKGAKDYFHGKSQSVDGLKVVDEGTFEIQLEKPFPPILKVLAGGSAKILPAKFVSEKDFFKQPIGSGPFKVEEIKKDQIILTRFSDYYGIVPQISKMILQEMPQEQAMSEAIKGKIHDLSAWPMNGKEPVFSHGKDIQSIVADTWIIGLNTRIAPFSDLKVRKLFQQSIDVEKFRKTFYPDAKSAFGYVPYGFPGHLEKAKETKTLIINPSKAPIEIFIPEELARTQEIAKFFEDELKGKGWNVRVMPIKWNDLMTRYTAKTMPAFLVSMIVDYPDSEFLLNNFESTNPDSFSGVKDKAIDELISKSRQTQDRIERQNIQEKLAERVNELSLSVNLFHSRAHYWVHKCVEGFKPNLLAVAYIDYRNVSLDKKCLTGGSLWK